MNFNQKWISILTQGNKEKMEEFEKVRSSSPSLPLAIMEYRRLESKRGRSSDITSINSIEGLQEAFLEPISKGQIDYLHNKIKGLKMDVVTGYKKIYQMHKKDKNKRFMYLVNCL